MTDWRYLLVTQPSNDFVIRSNEGADINLEVGDKLEDVLRKCGEKGWELIGTVEDGRSYVFKQPELPSGPVAPF